MNIVKQSVELGETTLSLETGRLARQAGGSVLVSLGETVVLVTATSSTEPREGVDFLPLTVDYVEKTYAGGRIPGGFFKREGRPTTLETLTCRLIDRPLRPLFPDSFYCETQVIALVLSADKVNDPALCAITGASAALSISDIPFNGPIAGVRVGRVDGQFVLNPTYAQRAVSDLDLLVAANRKSICMVEGAGRFISEDVIADALEFAQQHVPKILDAQLELQGKVGKQKRQVEPVVVDEKLAAVVRDLSLPRISEALKISEKLERYAAMDAVEREVFGELIEQHPEYEEREAEIWRYLHDTHKAHVRSLALDHGQRIDGRGLKETRDIFCEAGVMPRTHGSALFTRGETQALASITLGTTQDEQRLDLLTGDITKRFMLHYNFPPFCVGEVKFMRGPSRREIGHGALAERGVENILPAHDDFPYTIRVVSEILESNGSSSMASTCAASMALMDAGVPVSNAIAGIAMGMIQSGDKVAILTDILGDEDHLGDMDFKVIGSREGVSAIQMDVKMEGLDSNLMKKALEQAREARLHVLGKMEEAIDKPRESISQWAPRVFTVHVNPDRIKDVIGPGGKVVRSIVEKTGVTIDINDDGRVNVAAVDLDAANKAIELIKEYTSEAEIGKVYHGKVTRVTDFGAFVSILPGCEGLVHISELSDRRVDRVEDVAREGDEIRVRVIDIDRQGRVRLSRREAMAADWQQGDWTPPEDRESRPPRPRGRRPGGGRPDDRKPRRPPPRGGYGQRRRNND